MSVSIGNNQDKNLQEWAYRLRYPKTGLTFTFTDYGNKEYVGYSATLMSFLEYGIFKKLLNNRFKMNAGVGVFISSEIYLGHIGIEADLGYNFYKPFYEIEWKLNGFYWDFENEDGTIETRFVEREITNTYHLKHAILVRVGLKYYLFNNDKKPTSIFFIAANLNANLGQADFTELSLGYVHRFQFKEKK